MATLAHEGSKRYKEVFDLVHRREAAKPNQIWQADHTLLDLWVLTPSGRPGRPWLTLIEDDHSRAVAGYAVNLGAPSALTTALAFRQAIWRKPWPGWHVCGIPDAFHVDHGSDFTSAHLDQVMADLKMRAYFSLPGQPRGRGKVERIFGTVNQMCLPALPGYAPRGTPDRAGQARLTLAELDAAIGTFIRDIYNLTPHGETGLRAAAALGGRGVPPADARLARAARPAAAHRGQAAQDPPGRHPLPGAALPRPDAGRLRRRHRDHPLRPAGHGRDPRLHRAGFLCRAICPELAGTTVSLKDITAARNARRRGLARGLRERASVVDRLLGAHQEQPPPGASETPARPPPARPCTAQALPGGVARMHRCAAEPGRDNPPGRPA